jgi:hypothetical protein
MGSGVWTYANIKASAYINSALLSLFMIVLYKTQSYENSVAMTLDKMLS